MLFDPQDKPNTSILFIANFWANRVHMELGLDGFLIGSMRSHWEEISKPVDHLLPRINSFLMNVETELYRAANIPETSRRGPFVAVLPSGRNVVFRLSFYAAESDVITCFEVMDDDWVQEDLGIHSAKDLAEEIALQFEDVTFEQALQAVLDAVT